MFSNTFNLFLSDKLRDKLRDKLKKNACQKRLPKPLAKNACQKRLPKTLACIFLMHQQFLKCFYYHSKKSKNYKIIFFIHRLQIVY